MKNRENIIVYNPKQQKLDNKTIFTNVFKDSNGASKRYFSGIDAEIYFDDIYIDDAVSIAFNVQQQANPIYGYNSYIYDDIAIGARIINGQFTINFTQAAYLYKVLNTIGDIKISSSPIKTAPMWNKTFDIYMSYGDARQTDRIEGSTILVLEKVSITSCSQELDYTGKPVGETYSFVAKDINFIDEEEASSSSDNSNTKQAVKTVVQEYPVKSASANLSDIKDIKLKMHLNDAFNIKSILYKSPEYTSYEKIDILQQSENITASITGFNASSVLVQYRTESYIMMDLIINYEKDGLNIKVEQTIKANKSE